jgi:hypothetical protein
LRFVVEIALQSRVGIYFQRYLEYGGEYLRIVDMEVEMEIVFCFLRFSYSTFPFSIKRVIVNHGSLET